MGGLLEITLDVALKKHLTFNPKSSMGPETKDSSFGLLTPLLMSLSTKSFFIAFFHQASKLIYIQIRYE